VVPIMTVNRAKPFNVTLIQPSAYVHASALVEAADYVSASLRACGYAADRTTNAISPKAVNIVFCSHILDSELAAQIPRGSIIFNSERLVGDRDWPVRNPAYKALLQQHFVWDYSLRNLECIQHPNKAFVQFGYLEALRRRDLPRTPHHSLLFYGAITPWREHVLHELNRRGVNVRVLFGVYGEARDREMLSAWAVLNLHKERDESVFEPVRCFYPLINQVPVFSERVNDPTADFFGGAVFFVPAERLPEEIEGHLRNPKEFAALSEGMLKSFRSRSGNDVLRSAVEQYLKWEATSAAQARASRDSASNC
jgi:hypothetical protein